MQPCLTVSLLYSCIFRPKRTIITPDSFAYTYKNGSKLENKCSSNVHQNPKKESGIRKKCDTIFCHIDFFFFFIHSPKMDKRSA